MSIKSFLTNAGAVFVLVSSTAVVAAQQLASPGAVVPPGSLDRPTFGTLHTTIKSVNAFEFTGYAPGDLIATNASGSRWVVTGTGFMDAPLSLPSGVSIEWIEMMACDTSPTGQVTLRLFSNTLTSQGEPIISHGVVGTGVASAAGCDWTALPVTPPVTVDNAQRSYFLEVETAPKDGSVRIAAANVYYRLQVKPASGTALFNDVPVGHPLRDFVEALADSGITGGCGGGNYCPDAPLTRGQMAVFLAAALGLHWPF
jgi:hypothetical protein